MATSDRLGATSVETFSSRLVIGGGGGGHLKDSGGTGGSGGHGRQWEEQLEAVGGHGGQWGDIGVSEGHLGAVGGNTWRAIWG